MMKKVLFLCTGNSVRSQMAESLVNHDFVSELEAYSAGTNPQVLNPYAVQVVSELGIDIGQAASKNVSKFSGQPFDYVITLCDDANENCPVFPGGTKRLHMGFPDPTKAVGSEAQMLDAFRDVRDQIRSRMDEYFRNELKLDERDV